MAKRTEEKPFRPLETSLIQAVMHGSAAAAPAHPAAESRAESPRPVGLASADGKVSTPANPHVHRAHPPPSRRDAPDRAPEARFAERMEREKRVLLTPAEERSVERVVANMGAELGTSLKLSHVLRSCIRLVINAEDELIERARATGRMIRPPNSDLPGIEAFEKVIAGVLHAGFRSARIIR